VGSLAVGYIRESPLTLALSRRERGLTEVIFRFASTWKITATSAWPSEVHHRSRRSAYMTQTTRSVPSTPWERA